LVRDRFVVKKGPRPSEIDRPDVVAQRDAFLKWQRRQDSNRLVVLDEAGANLAMGRSHVWGQRGEAYVEPRPMNWGDNLTLVGAIRRKEWGRAQHEVACDEQGRLRHVGRQRLAPRLRPGDIVVLDNLPAQSARGPRLHQGPRRDRQAVAAVLA
jgi:hypothetical protein